VLPTIRSRCTLLTITGALEHDLKADYPNASQEQLYLSQGRSMRLEKLFEEGAQENINLLREFFNQALLKNHAKIKETIDILKKRDIALEECIEVLSLWLRQDVSKKSSERYEALMAFFEIAQNAHLDKGQSYLALFLLLGDPSKKYCLS
ncbi:MAG TPA: hypothetical protein VI959_00450, partial [Alphaproteobacteria bacterium]|nr:hypothetical protein [Alphaproteobacteria bacterium]